MQTEALQRKEELAVLLLDLRDPEEYELTHIKGAINYQAANITRDKLIPELFAFKNRE